MPFRRSNKIILGSRGREGTVWENGWVGYKEAGTGVRETGERSRRINVNMQLLVLVWVEPVESPRDMEWRMLLGIIMGDFN